MYSMEKSCQNIALVNFVEQYITARAILREALKATGRVYLSHREDDHFFQLPHQAQQVVVDGILNWSNTILEFVAQGGDHKNTKNLVRYYLSRMSLIAPLGFIDEIQNGDIVEIYGDDSKRLFFNPELFDYSSYAPDVMFSQQWWDLYHRDGAVSLKIHEYAIDMFVGRITAPFKPDLPICDVKETKSKGLYTSRIEMKCMSPVKVGEKVVGVACLEKLTLLSGELLGHTHSLS
ncbi:hypothetical protein B9G69_014210 [Bdellovibrio sp. SKB1291214]|uniref:hypothetical protein n=1 Tax=Bdellovibrio sp. SKB1291214 TaxID=1732569 RepID=UPI000B51CCF2|nr:hypothetical protein [Bdellovibrio sp. SKB1291214]UYL08202.1 hypothetical protein B9G69_014210 [Bdellovibrio sp. SKB1291214]